MQNKALEIKNLNYAFKSNWTFRKTSYLKNINLEVLPGEAFGFLGDNGAGKTTTIKCILGLIKPESGSIDIYGDSSLEAKSRTNVGFLPEQPYFYDHLKVGEILNMYATLVGVEKRAVNSETQRVLKKVRLEGKKNFKMRTLSKGQTQRVAMAQALLGSPKLLILDEPFSGLDPVGRKEFSDILFELKKEGKTIFICSHVLSDIEFLCDRISVMKKGQIKGVYKISEIPNILEGKYELKIRNFSEIESTIKELAESYKDQDKFLYLEFNKKEDAEKALSLAASSNAHVEEYKFKHGGLEELFINLVSNNE